MIIDLRSDTVTQPTDEMRLAMSSAKAHDYTLEGDPVVNALECKAAEMLGKDAALYLVGGTMGNLIGALVHSASGGEALVDSQAHIALSEAGGLSHLAGLYCIKIESEKGEMDLHLLEKSIRPTPSRYGLRTAMVNIETSHNHSGGYVPSLDYMRDVQKLAVNNGTGIHIDGARLFNAAAALNVEAKEIVQYGDSVSICLSKGLSAPMGAILAGSYSFIETARTYRRMVGGGLRQSAGIMAAAGLVALEKMPQRLKEDHENARILWRGIGELDERLVSSELPETNIFQVNLQDQKQPDATFWCQALEKQGVLVRPVDEHTLRLVTHRHINEEAIAGALQAFKIILQH